MSDLVGRKVRLVGPAWNRITGHREGAIRTVDRPLDRAGMYALDSGAMAWERHGATFGVEPLPPRERIHVYSFGVLDSSGGFFWAPVDRDPGAEEWVRSQFQSDADDMGSTNPDVRFEGFGVLAELWVAGYAPDDAGRQRVTDFIEGELQDAIGAGYLGKIIDRY